jgi:hypothetical protein
MLAEMESMIRDLARIGEHGVKQKERIKSKPKTKQRAIRFTATTNHTRRVWDWQWRLVKGTREKDASHASHQQA